MDIKLIWVEREAEYFCGGGLDRANHVEALQEIALYLQGPVLLSFEDNIEFAISFHAYYTPYKFFDIGNCIIDSQLNHAFAAWTLCSPRRIRVISNALKRVVASWVGKRLRAAAVNRTEPNLVSVSC